MIIPDKKKMATIIVANLHGPAEEDDSGGDSYQALAQEVLDAVKSESVSDLADALKAFFSACEAEEDIGEYEE